MSQPVAPIHAAPPPSTPVAVPVAHAPMADRGRRVGVVGCDAATLAWLQRCLGQVAWVCACAPAELGPALTRRDLDAVILGPRIAATTTDTLLEVGSGRVPTLRLGAPRGHGADDEDPRLFYGLSRRISGPDVALLVGSAAHGRGLARPAAAGSIEPADLDRVLGLASQLVRAGDLATATRILVRAAEELVGASRSRCVFHHAPTGRLWSEGPDASESRATRGMVGFAARTAGAACVPRADADPRWHPELDGPDGRGSDRLLVQSIAGADGQARAVVVAARDARHPPFGARERVLLASFAERAGPMLEHLMLHIQARGTATTGGKPSGGLFRAEAVQAHTQSRHRSDVVRVSPGWVRWTYWLMIALLIVSGAYLLIGEVDQHSSGHAIVRLHDRSDVVAPLHGALVGVAVQPGQAVEAGQLLARFEDRDAQADLQRTQLAFEVQLRKRLLDPMDPTTSSAVVSLRRELLAAQQRVHDRELRAPQAGIVGDLRIRNGQHIVAGQVVMSLLHEQGVPQVMALLPGGDRPQLQPGMPIRLEFPGFRYAYQTIEITEVGREVIGPTEARRFLGPQVADSLELAGPLVLVRGTLPGDGFVADGHRYAYHDGMLANAEIRLHRESLIEALFPPLKQLLGHD